MVIWKKWYLRVGDVGTRQSEWYEAVFGGRKFKHDRGKRNKNYECDFGWLIGSVEEKIKIYVKILKNTRGWVIYGMNQYSKGRGW